MRTRLIRALPAATLLAVSFAAPAAAAVINGTSGPDVLVGTPKADTIRGYGGADKIHGRAGADRIYAGAGADRIFAGRDHRRDLVHGGLGNDRINVRLGDTVYAGRGNDVVWVRTAAWKTTHVYCGPGYDVLNGYDPWLVSQSGCEKVNEEP